MYAWFKSVFDGVIASDWSLGRFECLVKVITWQCFSLGWALLTTDSVLKNCHEGADFDLQGTLIIQGYHTHTHTHTHTTPHFPQRPYLMVDWALETSHLSVVSCIPYITCSFVHPSVTLPVSVCNLMTAVPWSNSSVQRTLCGQRGCALPHQPGSLSSAGGPHGLGRTHSHRLLPPLLGRRWRRQ